MPRKRLFLPRKRHKNWQAPRLPSVPFPWSLSVHHQSLAFRSRLYHAKNEAPEEEADLAFFCSPLKNAVKCYYGLNPEYFFFAKFTVLTWFANHSVIRLRNVAFFGAKKTLVFFHLPAVWLPRIPDNCFVTSLSYFSVGRMTHFAQTMFGFSSTWMRSCIGKLYRLFTTLGFVMCTVSGSIRRWNKISNSFNCSYPRSDLFR